MACPQAGGGLLERLLAGAGDPASPSTREDALQGLRALAEGAGPAAEPHLLRALPMLLERQGDKVLLCPTWTAPHGSSVGVESSHVWLSHFA